MKEPNTPRWHRIGVVDTLLCLFGVAVFLCNLDRTRWGVWIFALGFLAFMVRRFQN